MSLMELREEANDAFREHFGTRCQSVVRAREAYLLDPRTTRFLDNLRRRGYGTAISGWGAISDGWRDRIVA